MQRNQVAATVELIVVNVLVNDAVVDELLVRVEVAAEDPHAEALADAAERSTDATGADNAGGLAVQGLADEALEVEVILTDADVTFVDAAVGAKGEAHSVLGDGLGRVCGNTGDLKAKILSNRHVDGIEASAAHENELDAEAGENLEGHGTSVGINEGADGVIATGEGGSHRSKVGLDEVDLDFRVILELLGEGVLVVARGTVEQNLHRVSLRMSARNYARVNPTLA